MLAELVTKLAELGRQAAGTTFTQAPLKDPRRMTFFKSDGTHEEFPIEPAVRNHFVNSVDDLKKSVEIWGEKGLFWHNTEQAVYVIDDADRRDVVTLPLVKSEQFRLLECLGQAMDQRQLVKLLRFDLRGCVAQEILDALRAIEITSSGRQNSEINPGREKGMREFQSDLTRQIPDVFDVHCPLYDTLGIADVVKVTCGLDYTLPPAPVQFFVKPVPGEMVKALHGVQMKLGTLLSDCCVPVVFGRP